MAVSIQKRVNKLTDIFTPPPATNEKGVTRPPFLLTKRAKIIVARQGEGQFIDGYWQDGDISYFVIYGHSQPLRGNELQVLPESERTKSSIKVYTSEKLRTVDEYEQKLADCVYWDGMWWRAYRTMTYKMGTLNHTKTLCCSIPETPQDKSSQFEIPKELLEDG